MVRLLIKDLKYLLINYIITKPIRIKKFIDINIENISDNGYEMLYQNPSALYLIEKHGKYDQYWVSISKNPKALHLRGITSISYMFANPSAVELIKPADFINYTDLSKNPNAMDILINNIDKINWRSLSKNPHPLAIELLSQNREKINWRSLSKNPGAINLINESYRLSNGYNIVWRTLAKNPHPDIFILLEEERLICPNFYWDNLSKNPAAIGLLEKNPKKIHKDYILKNPNIFDLDVEEYKILIKNYYIF